VVSWRLPIALVVEITLGAGVLAAGLITVAASTTEPAPAPAASAPPVTISPRAPATSAPRPTPATVARPATSTTTPVRAKPTTTVSEVPIVTHRAAIDVLAPRPVTVPVRVSIPALEVDGPVLPAGVNSDSELDVPPDARSLVWYRHGPSPGEQGSAVIAGHLNWRGVTGLFSDLASTPVGAGITVDYDNGSQRDFIVTTVELVPKPAISVHGVFARDGARVLRLVTCGGEFDDEVNSYRSNVVVTAVPA
jgi:hypothetical protein